MFVYVCLICVCNECECVKVYLSVCEIESDYLCVFVCFRFFVHVIVKLFLSLNVCVSMCM